MTSLERAKAFAQSSARLALSIVALAVAAASAAQGAVSFPLFTVTAASCPGATVSNLGINNNAGIKLCTGTSCFLMGHGFGQPLSLTLSARGMNSGIIPVSSNPVNVVFTPTFIGIGNIV